MDKETLEQSLERDLLDINGDKDISNNDIKGWIEHIKSTFKIYGYVQLPSLTDSDGVMNRDALIDCLVEHEIDEFEAEDLNDAKAVAQCQASITSALKDKEKQYWVEKCFNDTMSAKKSGWDDAEKFYKSKIETLESSLADCKKQMDDMVKTYFTLQEIEVLQECFMAQARSMFVTPEKSRNAPVYKKLEYLKEE